MSSIIEEIDYNENKALLENVAYASFDGNYITIVLFYNGKRVYYTFPGFIVKIQFSVRFPQSVMKEGPDYKNLSDDAFRYYIRAIPMQDGLKEITVELSKKESFYLFSRIKELEAEFPELMEQSIAQGN